MEVMEPRGVFNVEILGEMAMGEEELAADDEKVGGLTDEMVVAVVTTVVPS